MTVVNDYQHKIDEFWPKRAVPKLTAVENEYYRNRIKQLLKEKRE